MVRVKGGIQTRQNHKKILKMAKGFWMTRHKQIKKAKEAVLHAGIYAFAGRKQNKRNFRQLWIIRLNAAVRTFGIPYKTFIHGLKEKNICLDRKVLAQIAVEHPKAFESIVTQVKG
jgi:large subunit ribosomal protein L20